jgi:phosphoadenosine phosphosulfate reductase
VEGILDDPACLRAEYSFFSLILSIMTPSLKLPLSKDDLDAINGHLNPLTPEEILRWAIDHIPSLYQTTAFGLTGLVSIDILSKITTSPPPLIFLDTLYHFPETYELVEVVKARYSRSVIVYKPEGCATTEEFECKHGERLWERDEAAYDYAVKVGKEMHSCAYRLMY